MGLERLKLLFTWMNYTGAVPFRMILDEGQFRRIRWRHPITCWFILAASAQLIYGPVIPLNQISLLIDSGHSVAYVSVMSFWIISYM